MSRFFSRLGVMVGIFAMVGWSLPVTAVASAGADPADIAAPAIATAQEEAPKGEESGKKKKKKRKKKGDEPAPEKKKKGDAKPFDEVVKDTEKIEGLFTFYVKKDEGQVFLEILPDQLDQVFLLSPTLEGGIGENWIYAAWVLGEYPVKFRKIGKNVQFRIPNIWFRADSNPEMNRALTGSFSDSLLAQTKVASQPHPERESILIDLNDVFLRDLEGLQPFLKQVYQTGYAFDKEASYFGTLKGFPENVEIEMVQHYKTGEPKGSITLPDSRSMFLTFRYSLSAIPDNGYRPRLADDRVGTFNTIFQDYSSDRRETAYTRYVQRWNIEKEDPSAPLSPAKEPVVFWLENTIPIEYRGAVRQGALVWNKAFEKIGIQDAIVVKQQPDDADWDPADVRYNTIRWFVAPGATFAQGPSRANPFTGELYDADIRFSADMVRRTWQRHEEFVNPVALLDPPMPARVGHGAGPRSFCTHALGTSLQAAFGLELLTARGVFGAGSEEAEKFVNDWLVEVTAHEVGHTLGFRHNFKASSILANSDLHNAEYTSREGLGGSVMDYNPANIAPDGQNQGQYWQTTLGPYDYWVVEYAYKPIPADSPEGEVDELERIASKSSQPQLAYLTDEDTFGFSTRAIDPTSSLWDFGADPIAFNRGQVQLAHELWDRMDRHFDKAGERYQKYRSAIGFGVINVYVAAQNVPKYIGGIYHHRDHIGDPGGRMPFVPVTAAKQREALEFVRTEILSPGAFDFPPELLNKLAPERMWDFEGSPWSLQRIDYPVHDLVAAVQAPVLVRLYDPITMSRIVDQQVKFPAGQDPFTLAEVFTGLRTAVWGELDGEGANVNSYRRNLQRMQLGALMQMVLQPMAGTPEDAKTLARADLLDIKKGIERVLKIGSVDRITRAHFEETVARIDATLDAQMNRNLFPSPAPGS